MNAAVEPMGTILTLAPAIDGEQPRGFCTELLEWFAEEIEISVRCESRGHGVRPIPD